MQSVIMTSVIMLRVIVLSAVMLSVIMLIVLKVCHYIEYHYAASHSGYSYFACCFAVCRYDMYCHNYGLKCNFFEENVFFLKKVRSYVGAPTFSLTTCCIMCRFLSGHIPSVMFYLLQC